MLYQFSKEVLQIPFHGRQRRSTLSSAIFYLTHPPVRPRQQCKMLAPCSASTPLDWLFSTTLQLHMKAWCAKYHNVLHHPGILPNCVCQFTRTFTTSMGESHRTMPTYLSSASDTHTHTEGQVSITFTLPSNSVRTR